MAETQEPAHLGTLIDQLHATIGRVTLALALARDAFAWTDSSGRIIWCNPSFDRFVDTAHIELLGEPLTDCLVLERDGRPVVGDDHPARRILVDAPELTETYEASVGQRRSVVEVYGRRGTIEGEPTAVLVIQDITERVRSQNEMTQLNRRLESANRELEAFSYSVSHDLRTPLRRIDGFSQALLEDYANVLDDQGKDFVRRLRTQAKRMMQLIDDLIVLSRVTRFELASSIVDVSAMCREIAQELAASAPGRTVEVVIADGIKAQSDGRLLRHVLENLLSNAWKFTSKTSAARIEVGMTTVDDERALFVRDNGAGFDMARADTLFGAFQRLHGDDEFPGTGIGLAIVRRIVHRHGGRVWAEGKIGQGATFYVALPGFEETP